MRAVKAIYRNGKVTFSEKPAEPGPMEVLVVFSDATDDPWARILSERTPRPKFAEFADACLEQIAKGKASPLKLDSE